MPWVPADLYAVMLRGLSRALDEDGRLPDASVAVHETPPTLTAQTVPAVTLTPLPRLSADAIPDDVRLACVEYAAGDTRQVAVNLDWARQQLKRGVDPSDVLAMLAEGEEL